MILGRPTAFWKVINTNPNTAAPGGGLTPFQTPRAPARLPGRVEDNLALEAGRHRADWAHMRYSGPFFLPDLEPLSGLEHL